MAPKGYTFCYYVSGHGFGHATRVNQIITELLKSTADFSLPASSAIIDSTTATTTTTTSTSTSTTTVTTTTTTTAARDSRHTIYIVSDAPQFIFQDVIALGAIYRNAKVDSGVVQPLAYSVDRQQTIEGCKKFLSRRDEMIDREVTWLAQVGVDCVLADAPFLPCAAADAYGIPAILITNFTFDEVYRFLREGDALDKDVMACADAALEDYKRASLLLRLPGSIDIPAFEDEILVMEEEKAHRGSPSISDMDDLEVTEVEQEDRVCTRLEEHVAQNKKGQENEHEEQLQDENIMGDITPQGTMSPISMRTAVSSPNPSITSSLSTGSLSLRHRVTSFSSASMKLSTKARTSTFSSSSSSVPLLTRKAIDVPLVVRMAVNDRETVLRSLGVDEETIATKKMVLVSFGGQRLKQGWGNPLPEGWIGVICGLPVEHELPEGFYRSPHGVYVPDLTEAADIVIGKLGYGTCSECIAHARPLIYVPRPQFIEEHGLIKMMINHGLPVEMTAEEFETGHWQRAILEADRQATEEKEGRRLFEESCSEGENENENENKTQRDGVVSKVSKSTTLTSSTYVLAPVEARSLAESVNRGELAQPEPMVSLGMRRRSRRSSSVTSLSAFRLKGAKMARLSPVEDVSDHDSGVFPLSGVVTPMEEPKKVYVPTRVWFERRIPNNGGEVCARLVEEFMAQQDEYRERELEQEVLV